MKDPTPIRTTVEAAGITFGFGLVLRYMTAYRTAKERIEGGTLGEVTLAHARYGGMLGGYDYVFSPEVGGGLINEHTIHMIDMLDHLLGPIRAVAARLTRQPGRQTEDHAAILFRFDGDRVGALAASGMTRWPSRVEITGTRGEIAITDNSRLEERTEQGSHEIPLPQEADPYGKELEEWRQAIAEGRSPAIGLREALRITALIAAVHEAGRAGQWMEIP